MVQKMRCSNRVKATTKVLHKIDKNQLLTWKYELTY